MSREVESNYFSVLTAAIAESWNRFWYTPAGPAPLGAMRVLVGAISLYSIASYGPDLQAFMTPEGMLPKELMGDLYPAKWSLLNYVPAEQIELVHWASLLCLALLTIGVGGRAIVVLSTLLVLSYFNRAPVVTGEFEPILAFLLVYLCVGNACDAYSVRAWRRRTESTRPQPTAANAIALRLLQVHLALVHVMMGLAQLAADDAVWWSGEGLWLAAARPEMALVNLQWMAENHRLAAAWAHAIVLFFLAFPVLVWAPLLRPIALAAGIVIWLSVAVATGWLLFSACMLAGLVAYLDSPWLESLRRRGLAFANQSTASIG